MAQDAAKRQQTPPVRILKARKPRSTVQMLRMMAEAMREAWSGQAAAALRSSSELLAELELLRVRLETLRETLFETTRLCDLAVNALDQAQATSILAMLEARLKDVRHCLAATGSSRRRPLSAARWTCDLPEPIPGAAPIEDPLEPYSFTIPQIARRPGLLEIISTPPSSVQLAQLDGALRQLEADVDGAIEKVHAAMARVDSLSRPRLLLPGPLRALAGPGR